MAFNKEPTSRRVSPFIFIFYLKKKNMVGSLSVFVIVVIIIRLEVSTFDLGIGE